jgi:hypothetical protein
MEKKTVTYAELFEQFKLGGCPLARANVFDCAIALLAELESLSHTNTPFAKTMTEKLAGDRQLLGEIVDLAFNYNDEDYLQVMTRTPRRNTEEKYLSARLSSASIRNVASELEVLYENAMKSLFRKDDPAEWDSSYVLYRGKTSSGLLGFAEESSKLWKRLSASNFSKRVADALVLAKEAQSKFVRPERKATAEKKEVVEVATDEPKKVAVATINVLKPEAFKIPEKNPWEKKEVLKAEAVAVEAAVVGEVAESRVRVDRPPRHAYNKKPYGQRPQNKLQAKPQDHDNVGWTEVRRKDEYATIEVKLNGKLVKLRGKRVEEVVENAGTTATA